MTLIRVNGAGIREFLPKSKPGSGPFATVIWAHNSANEEYFGVRAAQPHATMYV